MGLDRFRADAECVGNFADFVAFADELENFEFAIGQKVDRIVGRGRLPGRPVMLQLRRNHRTEITPPVQCFPQGGGDVVDRVLFYNVTHRTGPESARGVKRFFVHGKNQHRQFWKFCANCFCQFDSARSGQADIDDDEIRSKLSNERHRILRCARLTTNKEFVF